MSLLLLPEPRDKERLLLFVSFETMLVRTLPLSEDAAAAFPLPATFDAEAELPVFPAMEPAVSEEEGAVGPSSVKPSKN